MRLRAGLFVLVVAAVLAFGGATASATETKFPRRSAPAWLTPSFRAAVDAAGTRGVPLAGPSALDVCPGVVGFSEGGVGVGTCLVYPYGCTANFIYYTGSGAAPQTSDGNEDLGSGGHTSGSVGGRG